MTNKTIRQQLAADEAFLFSWLMMPGGFQAGAYAGAGLDGVLIDMQHGIIGFRDMVSMVEAINKAGSKAIVRPPLDDFAMVSRALDSGASGIVCPMINSAGDAEKLVSASKFPPVGERSWGAYLGTEAMGLSKEEYLGRSNDISTIFAMIETGRALDNLDEICAVDGIDGVFVGPNDLSISLTKGKEADVNNRLVQEALPLVADAAARHGKFAGIFVSDNDDLGKFAKMGFRFMPVLSDASFITDGVSAIRSAIKI